MPELGAHTHAPLIVLGLQPIIKKETWRLLEGRKPVKGRLLRPQLRLQPGPV